MNVLVINLPRHADRLAFQAQQLARLELPFEVVPACEVNAQSPGEWQALSMAWERPMRAAEVGCFLSHRRAWQSVLDGAKPALILEDDAYLADTVPALLAALEQQQPAPDLVTLETRGRKKMIGAANQAITPALRLSRLYQDRTGAAAYVLWPSGARLLLNKAACGHSAIADAFISSHYAMHAYQVEPAAAVQLDMCAHYNLPEPLQTQSSIGHAERPPAPSAWMHLIFKGRRVAGQVRMGLRLLRSLPVAHRRMVGVDATHFHDRGPMA